MIQIDIETLTEVREKLANKATRQEGMRILGVMKEIREGHQWRAGAMPSCCVNLDNYCCKFGQEIELLDGAITKLESGNDKEAYQFLDTLQEQLACEIGRTSGITQSMENR